MKHHDKKKIGIIGTGFIGGGLKKTINGLDDMVVSSVLTRRNLNDFPDDGVYTNSYQELIDKSDLVVECNGDPVYVTEIINKALTAGRPVVTMDSELHITSGSFLSTRGLITEAEGDQPGALAALNHDLVTMGFKPLVYGNLKGFLNHNPTREDMLYWAKVGGISLDQVTSFTDGTKIQIEQVLVANGLGATIGQRGMYGFESEDIDEGSIRLADKAKELGKPISDYLLCSPSAKKKFPAGIFITAEYDQIQAPALKYLKLGPGPYYTMIRNYHLCHLEIPITIRHVFKNGEILLNNSDHPVASVGVIAKKSIPAGTFLERSERNFQIRGEAILIKDHPNHVPVGLISDVVIKRQVEPGQMLTFDDVDVPDSLALRAWRYTLCLA